MTASTTQEGSGTSSSSRKAKILQDDATVVVPKNMSDALDCEDPVASLRALSAYSKAEAERMSLELAAEWKRFSVDLPEILLLSGGDADPIGLGHRNLLEDHPVHTATACSDSILHSLTKIASGGSQASHEIRQLEQEKRDLEEHAEAVQTALMLRKNSDRAAHALQSRQWMEAAEAIRPWLDWKEVASTSSASSEDKNARCRAYAGEYSLQQLGSTYQQLKNTLLLQYEAAVQESDLQALGTLTPVLSLIQLEQEAVGLYLQFLKGVLQASMKDAAEQQQQPPAAGTPKRGQQQQQPQPPFAPMGRIYNAAVAALRHHLPMVSHCLHKADGDAAVVQLVHVQVEEAVLPLLTSYQRDRQLSTVSRHAQRIYAALEERYAPGTRSLGMDDTDNSGADSSADDCGFSASVGSLSDVDAAMEESALCVQHAESYLRFIQHTCLEVNRARQIRFEREREAARVERERQEWTAGRGPGAAAAAAASADREPEYQPLQILPPSTQLHQEVAELGGQYAIIERCLLLASMQRAFVGSDADDPRYYRPLTKGSGRASAAGTGQGPSHGGGVGGGGGGGGGLDDDGGNVLQTALVETCFYASRRGTQRAFATGHTGTASAMTNFAVDCLSNVLLEVMSHRAEESGVALLKPGDGLLVGSTALFNTASTFIRQGTNVGATVVGASSSQLAGGAAHHHTPHHHLQKKADEQAARRQRLRESVARACATLNDLEVAYYHTEQLEVVLAEAISRGFPPDTHETEQLRMCVRSLGPVRDGFRAAADSAVESLESVLKPRVRSIVAEAVGTEGSSSSGGFMGSSVMGGSKPSDRSVMVRMKYDLDEESYDLLQLSEGYVARLCTSLDELLEPLREHLAPRLWDALLLSVLGSVSKRLETSLRKCRFTALGALTLDSDMRDLLSYTKDRLHSPDYASNVAVARACLNLARLLQIARLLNVDDLEDVLDLISSGKRKGHWDLKLEDAKAFLSARVEFEASKVNELLRLPDDD